MIAAASTLRLPAKARVTRTNLFPYLSIAPAVVLVAAVSLLPLLYAIVQSFYKSDYLKLGEFVGLGNYAEFLFGPDALPRIWASVYFVLGTILLSGPIGLGLALLLNQPIRFRAWFRTILIIPWLVSALVTGLLWAWLFDPNFSPVMQGVETGFGIELPGLLTSFELSMPALIVAHSWACYPMIMVFSLAALQTVPTDLLEAARIDGANALQRFFYVSFPYIKSSILVALVLTTLNSFNHVTMILVMTGGGPVGTTETMALRVFLEGFKFYRMGTATAGAVAIFAVNVLFAILYARVLREQGRS
jgi:multiple sugar transport system permease protein